MSLPYYLRPRMLGLHAATLAAIAAMIWLGLWQYGRWDAAGERASASSAASQPAVAITSLLHPGQDLPRSARGRHVTATGTYVASGQVLLPGRTREDTRGYWVLTPLKDPEGNVLAVLRGWVREPSQAADPPGGTVEVSGQLQQAEPIDTSSDPLPDGQAQEASPVVLASLVDAPFYPGVLVLQAQKPPQADAPLPVRLRVEGGGRGGAGLRNLAYATQWWIFVGFAIWFWSRLVRDMAPGTARIKA